MRGLVGSGASGIMALIREETRTAGAAGGHRCNQFGTILDGGMLLPDGWQDAAFPLGTYQVAAHLLRGATDGTAVGDHGTHTHETAGLEDGMRVVITWVGKTPVIGMAL